jgi:fused signal recognition particle receptor
MLVAGDTFRAAAIGQLKVWAERIGVPIIAGRRVAMRPVSCSTA